MILIFFSLVNCRIVNLELSKDERNDFFIGGFGYHEEGTAKFKVSNFVAWNFKNKPEPKDELLNFGFIIIKMLEMPDNNADTAFIKCTDFDDSIKDHYVIKKNLSKWDKGFTQTIKIKNSGAYWFFFKDCSALDGKNSDIGDVSMNLEMTMYNGDHDYLSAGEDQLPGIYGLFVAAYLVLTIMWIIMLKWRRRDSKLNKLHLMMTIVIVAKLLAMFSKAIQYRHLQSSGRSEGWNIAYYIFMFTKGVVMFIVIILLGTGYSLIKNALSEKEKKLFVLIIPLQILVNVMIIIKDEMSPGSKGYFTWWDILNILDITCVCLILFPIIWTINAIKKAALVDGKRAISVQRLKVFKQFYLITIIYVYWTRIIMIILRRILNYDKTYIADFFTELSTFLFYSFIGIKFRPHPENIYVRVYDESSGSDGEDVELLFMDEEQVARRNIEEED